MNSQASLPLFRLSLGFASSALNRHLNSLTHLSSITLGFRTYLIEAHAFPETVNPFLCVVCNFAYSSIFSAL